MTAWSLDRLQGGREVGTGGHRTQALSHVAVWLLTLRDQRRKDVENSHNPGRCGSVD